MKFIPPSQILVRGVVHKEPKKKIEILTIPVLPP